MKHTLENGRDGCAYRCGMFCARVLTRASHCVCVFVVSVLWVCEGHACVISIDIIFVCGGSKFVHRGFIFCSTHAVFPLDDDQSSQWSVREMEMSRLPQATEQ